MPDFLLEIGLEEIPARMIDGAEAELRKRVTDVLQRESLAQNPEVEPYSTPRRVAVLARGIAGKQADAEEQVLGPSVKVAYKDGQPTAAALAFARKVNVDVAQLKSVTTPKGEYLAATLTRKGRTAQEILAEALPGEINALYWAKNMYWRAGKPERLVRPLRWMVSLLGDQVVPLEYAGIRAARKSRGHRMLGHDVEVKEPASYAADLKATGVFARREDRLALIRKELDRACRTVAGARWREDKELLETVVNLTEYPAVILGNFESEFLSLPEEVLVTVMRDHQKYFAVEDASGKLAAHFLAVLNIDGDPNGIIQHGHERVLRARFNDARFFWTVDQKQPLRERVERLKNVTFQKDLGTYYDKTERVQKLASQISQTLEDAGVKVRAGIVHKAALLAKTDLTTELVKEFTELQGIVGGLYAKAQGLDPAIGDAIYDQYKPESMEDAVPRTLEGAVLSLADKVDSIAGMFALDFRPSGSKDPFALRRQANAVVKIIAEHKLQLRLSDLLGSAAISYKGSETENRFKIKIEYTNVAGRLRKYFETPGYDALAGVVSGLPGDQFVGYVAGLFRERLQFYLRDVLGFAYDVANAVLAAGADNVVDAVARAQAVAKVRTSEDFEAISAAFKRIKNILRQAREAGKAIAPEFKADAAADDAERALAQEIQRVAPRARELSQKRDYSGALSEIATIRPAVDTFFDKVMVMVEDERVRANRLALLQSLLNEFSTIADFSEIVTEKR